MRTNAHFKQETAIFGPKGCHMKLDRYDRAIVRALQLDGRITNSSAGGIRQLVRISVLETSAGPRESGFIEGYTRSSISRRRAAP